MYMYGKITVLLTNMAQWSVPQPTVDGLPLVSLVGRDAHADDLVKRVLVVQMRVRRPLPVLSRLPA